MLNKFKDKQPLAYNLFTNDIKNNCVTHAYLIEENSYSEAFDMVLSFVKSIVCEKAHLENHIFEECSLCKRIEIGNYPEVKVICADGMYIKKNQIIELQQEFSRTAVEGKKRIYIIRDCEKMRAEASNSMLKFLEEPEDNLIAILMTNNINNVLSTIVSRCKVIKLNSCTSVGSYNDELKILAISFIESLETKGIYTIVDIKNLWFSIVSTKDRDKMISVLDIMIDFYYDMSKVILGNNNINNFNLREKVIELSKLNSLESVFKKIDVLLDAKDSVKFNVNNNLLVDNIVVSIGGISNDSRY